MQPKTASIASHSATAVGVLAIGLLLSAAASYRAANEVARDAKANFELAVAAAEDGIERRIQANTDVLHGVRGLFSASESVSRVAFRRYVTSLSLEQRYPGIQVVTFSRRVPFERRRDYEAEVRRDTTLDPKGYPNFAIRPAGDRPEYFVAEYLEPMAGNEEASGLDIGGDPVRLASVEQARDSGLATATGPLMIERGGAGHIGFVIRLPVYRNGMPQQTVEQRRAALLGMISTSHRMDYMMRKALSEQALRQFRIRIHDAGAFNGNLPSEPPTARNLLFDNGQLLDSGSAQPGPLPAIAGGASLAKTLALDVGGRRWHMYISARQELGNLSDRWLPFGVLFGGISISLLLFGLIRSLATVSSRATTLAASITEDLRRSEASLAKAQRQTQELIEALPNPIFFKRTDGRYLGVNRAWETFFGVPRNAFIGKTAHDLYPDNPEIAERLQAKDLELWEHPGTQTYETSITTPDGQHHDVVYYKATFTHTDGSVAGLIGTIVDISDRKQAEAARTQLAAIVEHSNDAIFSRTLDGTILSWNAGAEKMLGYTAAEAVGKLATFTLPPGRQPNMARNNEKVLRGEMIAPHESNRMTKDGRVIDVLTSHSPIKDGAGNIVGASVILQDITALKQAQAAAQASEERFRATFDQAAVGIVHTSYEGNYLLVNQKFCDMLGYREYELVGRAAADFTHPDDRATGRQKRQLMWDGKLDGFAEEKRYLRKDGSVIWTNRTVSLARDASGKPQYFIRVIEDITQRKEAEERYRATFENAPVGIMHTAIDGYRILRANRKLCEMLGYTREELLGMTSTDVVHPDYRFSDRVSYRQPILDGARQAFASERKFVRKDGSSFWVNRTVSVVRNAAGEPLYFIRIVEDIDERKQAEAALRDSEVRYRSVIAAI
ncbi:MAG: PAS domain S-box protein, partial [Verrucomicrobia bacterium]|nr:PAS domain S-box protein [Verrucomicrobiota bacterium]